MSETTVPANGAIDKKALYGEFMEGNKEKRALYLKAAHKALDIPDDDMEINNTKVGIGAGGLAAIAAAVGVPSLAASGILAYALLNQTAPAVPVAEPQAVDVDVLKNFRVKFYDKDGNLIEVPHVSQLKQE